MRIAIISGDDACGALGEFGSPDELHQFCAALPRHGLEVTSYLRHRDASAVQDQAHRVVSSSVGPVPPVPPVEVLPHVGEWAAELSHAWEADPPDIVHAFGWLGGLAAQLAARHRQLPVVQSFYGLAAADGTSADRPQSDVERARLEPLLVRNATWVTGGSTAEVNALTTMRRRRAQVSVLSTGIDVERYASLRPKEGGGVPFRVLQLVPNALPCNGLDRTIRILPRLPGTELVIAETGPVNRRLAKPRAALQRMAAELGVRDRVSFLGAVTPEQVPDLLQSADVVACTEREAPRGTAALQAMAGGVVVAGVATDALTDIVINGVTGLLVSPTSPLELVFALKTLQSQSFQRQSMGSAGRSRAVSRFSWDRVALDALRIYEQTQLRHLSPPRRGKAATANVRTLV